MLFNSRRRKNGKWSEDVEKMLVGRDSEANKLIAAYLAHLAIPEYTELIVLLEIQRIKSIEAFSGMSMTTPIRPWPLSRRVSSVSQRACSVPGRRMR
jgi:hypothetical protein